ncbi:Endoribonuclease L-PSP/chorismate mutase-like protein [Podospora conica]|nr:Endoribonuclease L-PSP/chorismate mutase-like protein [Schizothecium conicum]
MPPSNPNTPLSTPFILPPTTPANNAAALANYPHARLLPPSTTATQTIYISGTSSRRGDGTYAGCTANDTDPPSFALDCAEQTAAVLSNIDRILRGATAGRHGLECVVDATVFLTDMAGDYARMNGAWNAVWPDAAAAPARTCVEVSALPGGGRLCVEIKCVAVVPVVAAG